MENEKELYEEFDKKLKKMENEAREFFIKYEDSLAKSCENLENMLDKFMEKTDGASQRFSHAMNEYATAAQAASEKIIELTELKEALKKECDISETVLKAAEKTKEVSENILEKMCLSGADARNNAQNVEKLLSAYKELRNGNKKIINLLQPSSYSFNMDENTDNLKKKEHSNGQLLEKISKLNDENIRLKEEIGRLRNNAPAPMPNVNLNVNYSSDEDTYNSQINCTSGIRNPRFKPCNVEYNKLDMNGDDNNIDVVVSFVNSPNPYFYAVKIKGGLKLYPSKFISVVTYSRFYNLFIIDGQGENINLIRPALVSKNGKSDTYTLQEHGAISLS